MTIAAMVLIVVRMSGFAAATAPTAPPAGGVKAAATWPITREIDGKIAPARIAASVPLMSKNLSKPVI